MTPNDIETRARAIVAEHLSMPPEAVTAEAHMLQDLRADSEDAIELLMWFEEEFGISLDDEAVEAAQTFGDWCRLIAAAIPTAVA